MAQTIMLPPLTCKVNTEAEKFRDNTQKEKPQQGSLKIELQGKAGGRWRESSNLS